MADIGLMGGGSQYDEDNDAYMFPPISQSGLDGGGDMPLSWHFGQVFGERSPGEEVLDGVSCYFLLHCIESCVSYIYCL